MTARFERHQIYWDGECGLCRHFAQWVERKDAKGVRRFDLVPFQDAPDPPMDPAHREANRRAVHVYTRDGRWLRAGRSVLFVLSHLGPGWKVLAAVGRIPPFIWIVELGYVLVARNRGLVARAVLPKKK